MRQLVALTAASAVAVAATRRRQVTLTMASGRSIVAALGSCFAALAVGVALGANRSLIVAGTVVLGGAPALFRRRRRDRQSRRQAARWPDFIAAVRARLAAGSAIPAACAEAGRLIGGKFESLAGPPGLPFTSVIATAREIWSDPLADRVLTTLEVASRVGGSQVGSVLAALSTSLGDELRLRRAHEAALTEQRLTASVALFAPWVILLLSTLTNPTAAGAFATPTGDLIVGAGAAVTLMGFALARRTARLSRPPRLFR